MSERTMWADIGAVRARKMRDGRAAYKVRCKRSAPRDWQIEAAHGAYLGKHPFNHGPDAWRISLLVDHHGEFQLVEVGHMVATSEAEAFEAVAWLAAVADERGVEPELVLFGGAS